MLIQSGLRWLGLSLLERCLRRWHERGSTVSNLQYMDLYVNAGSWQGISGQFVLWCDQTHKDTCVDFTYSHKDGALAVSGVEPELATKFRDIWLKDAEEEYQEFVKPLRGKN